MNGVRTTSLNYTAIFRNADMVHRGGHQPGLLTGYSLEIHCYLITVFRLTNIALTTCAFMVRCEGLEPPTR